ncbi:MAG: hypothetical protein Unbinned2902contig1001_49 [Prokaryotic dsDNA virus sp.]|nr:MAG: hypothetical protein Unbinned2902contig1001_49 [Prokaryotic dsDNA virus sp.]|tara:strand:- start:34775 stop:35044 length:270 start_codon:yes stop_codon:yes gene_type:complete
MPIKQMEAVAEQQMVKAVLPFVVAGIMAVVGWLFSTVMELEKTALKNNQAVIVIQSDSDDVWDDIEELQRDVTNLRIYIGNGSRNNPHH